MIPRRTSAVRRRRVGAAAALACAGAATLSGVVLAAPVQAAATGLFLYTDGGTGSTVPMLFPEEEKCFDVFKGKEAKNFTTSDVILFKDGLCSEVLVKLVPGESLNLGFNSFGFTPQGATASPPAVWEPVGGTGR